MEGKAIFFHRAVQGGEGQKSMGQGAAPPLPPLPTVRGGAGRGRGGEHTVGISWLQSYSAAKDMLICIASIEFDLLNIHNLDRNHN